MRLNNFFFAIYNNKRFWRLIVTNNASSIDNYNIIVNYFFILGSDMSASDSAKARVKREKTINCGIFR